MVGEGKTKGLILDNLFGMFCYFIKSGVFDFLANVLANVSGVKEGREQIFESNMVPKIFDMLRFDKVNQHRRKHLLECVRNLAFEYEGLEAKLTEQGFVKELGHILSNEAGITEGLPESVISFKADKAKESVNK